MVADTTTTTTGTTTTTSVPYLQIDLTATPPEGGDLEVIEQIDTVHPEGRASKRPSKEGTRRAEGKPRTRSRSLVKRLGGTDIEANSNRRQRHSFHSSFNNSFVDDPDNEETLVNRRRRRSLNEQDGLLRGFGNLEIKAGECVAPRRRHQQRQQHHTNALQALVLANANNQGSDSESESETALEATEELGTKKRSKASKAKSALKKLTNKVKGKMFGGDNKAEDKAADDCETTKESESLEHVEDLPSVSTEVRATA
jgi:hypothetical protein